MPEPLSDEEVARQILAIFAEHHMASGGTLRRNHFFLHRATLWVLFRNKCIVALVAVVAVGMWATLFALSIMSTAIRLRQRVGDEI